MSSVSHTPVRLNSEFYGADKVPASSIKRHGIRPGNTKTRLVLEGLDKNKYKIFAKNIAEDSRLGDVVPKSNFLTRMRFLPLKVGKEGSDPTWVLVNINSLRRLGLTKSEIKKAFKEERLEEVVNERVENLKIFHTQKTAHKDQQAAQEAQQKRRAHGPVPNKDLPPTPAKKAVAKKVGPPTPPKHVRKKADTKPTGASAASNKPLRRPPAPPKTKVEKEEGALNSKSKRRKDAASAAANAETVAWKAGVPRDKQKGKAKEASARIGKK